MATWQGTDPTLLIIKSAVQRGLMAEANAILREAKPRTPRETGDLEASGEVVGPEWNGAVCTVVVGFGRGPDPLPIYSIVQHERLDYRHDPGRIAKWLEVTAMERMTGMSDRIAATIIAAIGGAGAS